jgi:hypothetical protein
MVHSEVIVPGLQAPDVGWMLVAHEAQAVVSRHFSQQQIQHPGGRAHERILIETHRLLAEFLFLGPGSNAPAPMRSWIRSIDEPTALPGRCRKPQRLLLAVDEGLEVIQDDRLGDDINMFQRERLEKERMAAQPGGVTGDGGVGAAE